MAQVLKVEVQERIVVASERVFAEVGYRKATMAQIGRAAGVSTGNLYRYFENKDTLFYSIFTDDFADTLMRVLRKRVDALVRSESLTSLDREAESDADDLLRFWHAHRFKVIALLDRAEGSLFEDFHERFVDALVAPSLAKLAVSSGPNLELVEFTLRCIFRNTVRTIVAVLEANEDELAMRRAFEAFWSYQLAGLEGLERWVGQ